MPLVASHRDAIGITQHPRSALEADRPWRRRLAQLAGLESGWHPDGGGSEISQVALSAARDLLRSADVRGDHDVDPAIFPLSDGGVQVEWASPQRVTTLEISPTGACQFFEVQPERTPPA